MNDERAVPRGRSRIRVRLTAWYSVSILALLLIAVLSMRTWSRNTVANQELEATNRGVEMVRSFFRTELAEYRSIEPTLAHVSGELVFAEMTVEFLRPDGTTFGSSARPASAGILETPVVETLLPLDEQRAPGWMVRLRASGAARLRAEERIDLGALIAIPLVAIAATFVGWLVTGRALQPVRAMAQAAEDISSGTGTTRLPVLDPQDEFGRLGRQFNGLLDQLASTLSRQRHFLTDAAHELRTPIARMLSTAELQLTDTAQSNGSTSAADRLALSRIRYDLQNVSTLVNELMQLARADAGNTDVVLEPGYLDDVVTDAIGIWDAEAGRHSLTLEVDALEEARVRLDARLVERLLGVLISNAIAYTPAGGRISVRVFRDGPDAVLEVEDSGIGIEAGAEDRVFERFYRGRDSRAMRPEGSGLGLSIAALIVRVHAGRITVSRRPQGGTIARVALPSLAA